jgi:hypothetical protein
MIHDIVEVKPLGDYRLWLKFNDGNSGEVDISEIIEFTGVFKPLKNRTYFRRVRILSDLGTIAWPNEADIDPLVLYSAVTGKPIDWETDEMPEYTNPVLEDAKRLRIATRVIDVVAQEIITSRKKSVAQTELKELLCRMLPWANPETVSRRSSYWIRMYNRKAKSENLSHV